MKRRAFTIIELLVVIAILGVLASLLVIGIGHLQNSAKRRQTEQTLANCQAMFAEYDASQRTSYRNAGPMACPQNVNNDYYLSVTQPGGNPATATPAADRYANAVLLSRDIMFLLRAMPTNATALAKMPADALMSIPNPTFPTISIPSAYAATSYNVSDRVSDNKSPATYYACVQSGTPAAPPSAGQWVIDPASNVILPIPLDAWGNPIIFVPSGLGKGATWTGKGAIPPGELGTGGRPFTQTSPDGRPFFASAGPDGDFSKGDDNIYSFEK